jgi:hypothetical protein
MRISWLIASLLLSVALAYLQHIAFAAHWFYFYPWSDTLLHAVGGAGIGCLVVGFFYTAFRPRAYLVLVTAAVVGWEVFEYHIGSPRAYNFVLDTASDLLFDTIGALIPYVLARFTLWRSA